MKARVMFRRQMRYLFLPVVCWWPGMIAALLLFRWLFATLGWTDDFQVPLLAGWLIVCAVIAATHFREEFNLGMQTGVSRRHIFTITLGVWGLALAVIVVGLGIVALVAPGTPLLQDLGYVGVWDQTARVASATLVVLMLVAAACAGLTFAVANATLSPAWLSLLGIGLFWLLWWASFASGSAHLTQNIANGSFTVHRTGAAATPYLWPVLLAIVDGAMLVGDWLVVRRLEPRAK
ncbi:hypothetical protein [Lacticaseibacillus sp. GG6-2]